MISDYADKQWYEHYEETKHLFQTGEDYSGKDWFACIKQIYDLDELDKLEKVFEECVASGMIFKCSIYQSWYKDTIRLDIRRRRRSIKLLLCFQQQMEEIKKEEFKTGTKLNDFIKDHPNIDIDTCVVRYLCHRHKELHFSHEILPEPTECYERNGCLIEIGLDWIPGLKEYISYEFVAIRKESAREQFKMVRLLLWW